MPDPTRGLPDGARVLTHGDWYDVRHHTRGGFRNVYAGRKEPSFARTMGWLMTSPLRRKTNVPPPVRLVDPEALAEAPARLRATWLGHASVYFQTPEAAVLTDPVFSDRASPVAWAGPEREIPLPLAAEDLPQVDVVLISHDHYDHLDEASIRALAGHFDPVFLVPLGVGRYVEGWGARRVAELDWWQYVDLTGLRFHCTPSEHFSGRSLRGRDGTLWASWYVEGLDDELRVYYGADSAMGDHFREIRERLGAPEVALLPIGAYLPRWLMGRVHVTPEEAIEAWQALEAGHVLPIHWGTFDLADEPLQEPPRRALLAARKAGLAERLLLWRPGASVTLGADGPDDLGPADRLPDEYLGTSRATAAASRTEHVSTT